MLVSWEITIKNTDSLVYGFQGDASSISWGDGSDETNESNSVHSHTYSSPGVYIISAEISGDEILFGAVNGKVVTRIITDTSTANARKYAGCSSLAAVPVLENPGAGICSGCSSIKYAKVIGSFVDSTGLFSGCSSLQRVDITCDTVASDTFAGCSALEDATVRTDEIMDNAFADCKKLKRVSLYGEGQDIHSGSKVICHSYSFSGCSELQSVNFDNLMLYDYAFSSCEKLTTVDGGDIYIAGSYVFENCYELTNLYVNEIDLCSKSGSFSGIFENNHKIRKYPSITFYDSDYAPNVVPEILDFSNAFFNNISLVDLPFVLPIDEDARHEMNFSNMYAGCININDFVDLSYFQDRDDGDVRSTNCFYFCINLANYSSVPVNMGGGIVVSGSNQFELTGGINTLLQLQLDTQVSYNGQRLDIVFESTKMPEGFTVSNDGIISGESSGNIIGAYTVLAKHDDYVLKTITINFRITRVGGTEMSVGIIGYKIGNKFIKITV